MIFKKTFCFLILLLLVIPLIAADVPPPPPPPSGVPEVDVEVTKCYCDNDEDGAISSEPFASGRCVMLGPAYRCEVKIFGATQFRPCYLCNETAGTDCDDSDPDVTDYCYGIPPPPTTPGGLPGEEPAAKPKVSTSSGRGGRGRRVIVAPDYVNLDFTTGNSFTRKVKETDILKFSYQDKTYYVQVASLSKTKISFKLMPENRFINVGEGQSQSLVANNFVLTVDTIVFDDGLVQLTLSKRAAPTPKPPVVELPQEIIEEPPTVKKKVNVGFIVIAGLAVVLIIGVASFAGMRRKAIKGLEKSMKHMHFKRKEEAYKYLKHMLGLGYSLDQIGHYLHEAGWTKEHIKQIIEPVRKKQEAGAIKKEEPGGFFKTSEAALEETTHYVKFTKKQELEKYMKEMKDAGYSKEQIFNVLKKSGWSQRQIEKVSEGKIR